MFCCFYVFLHIQYTMFVYASMATPAQQLCCQEGGVGSMSLFIFLCMTTLRSNIAKGLLDEACGNDPHANKHWTLEAEPLTFDLPLNPRDPQIRLEEQKYGFVKPR